MLHKTEPQHLSDFWSLHFPPLVWFIEYYVDMSDQGKALNSFESELWRSKDP